MGKCTFVFRGFRNGKGDFQNPIPEIVEDRIIKTMCNVLTDNRLPHRHHLSEPKLQGRAPVAAESS